MNTRYSIAVLIVLILLGEMVVLPVSMEVHSATQNSVNITSVYSSSPAPVGIADYGIENSAGQTRAYKMALSSAEGTAVLNNMTYSNGVSLQLNVVIRVNTTTSTYVYWLQNVLSQPPKNFTGFHPELSSSIWNWTAPYASLSQNRVSGLHGDVLQSCYGVCVGPNPSSYVGGVRFSKLPLSLPLGLRLRINVTYSGSRVLVDFSNATAEGSTPLSAPGSLFDSVAITEPTAVTSAAILVDGHEMTPGVQLGRLTYYDAEFVFGAWSNLETTTFASMNSTIAMSYTLENGSSIAPLSVYEFGETGEKSSNLAMTPTNQLHGFQFHVGLGRTNFLADYIREPRTLDSLTVSYSVPGGPLPGMTSLLDYVNNGTEIVATLGTNPATLRADEGTVWQVLTSGLPLNSTVRWAPSPANGRVSGPQTIHPTYYRQFLVHLGFNVAGGGTGYSSPTITFDRFGSLTSAQAGSSVWIDAMTSYSYSDLLTGSNSSIQWISNDTKGTVLGPGEIQATYQPQYQVTISVTGGGIVSYSYGRVQTTGTVSSGMARTFYVPAGTEISVSAAPSSFWYGFNGWSGAGGSRGSQIQEVISSPTILKGEFALDLSKVTGIIGVVGVVLAMGALLVRRRLGN